MNMEERWSTVFEKEFLSFISNIFTTSYIFEQCFDFICFPRFAVVIVLSLIYFPYTKKKKKEIKYDKMKLGEPRTAKHSF